MARALSGDRVADLAKRDEPQGRQRGAINLQSPRGVSRRIGEKPWTERDVVGWYRRPNGCSSERPGVDARTIERRRGKAGNAMRGRTHDHRLVEGCEGFQSHSERSEEETKAMRVDIPMLRQKEGGGFGRPRGPSWQQRKVEGERRKDQRPATEFEAGETRYLKRCRCPQRP
jgi:hypothetical protein